MDKRLKKDEYYVDIIGTYNMLFVTFGFCVVPLETLLSIGIFLLFVMIFVLYARRRKINRQELPSQIRLSHINLMITQYWRFTYLSAIPFIFSAIIVGAFGHHDAWTQLQDMLQSENSDPLMIENLMNQYKEDNAMLSLVCNILFYQPVIWYILYKLYKGYKAFKAGEIIENPKDWSVK